MPSQLLVNDKIGFIVAKPFTSAGKDYTPGDDFPQEDARDIEVLVRARFVIPVVDDAEDRPRNLYKMVKVKSEALERISRDRVQLRMHHEPDAEEVVNLERLTYPERTPQGEEVQGEDRVLGVEEQEGSPPAGAVRDAEFDPSYHTVIEVNEYLASHPEDRDRVLEAERSGRERKGILEA